VHGIALGVRVARIAQGVEKGRVGEFEALSSRKRGQRCPNARRLGYQKGFYLGFNIGARTCWLRRKNGSDGELERLLSRYADLSRR
jgi:hypothetical protein